MNYQAPLPHGSAALAVIRCVASSVVLLVRRRVRLPRVLRPLHPRRPHQFLHQAPRADRAAGPDRAPEGLGTPRRRGARALQPRPLAGQPGAILRALEAARRRVAPDPRYADRAPAHGRRRAPGRDVLDHRRQSRRARHRGGGAAPAPRRMRPDAAAGLPSPAGRGPNGYEAGSRHMRQSAGPPGSGMAPWARKPWRSYSARLRSLVASR